METIQIICQVLSAILTVLAVLQKEKWKMMLIYTINCLISIAMYFSFGRFTSSYIYIVAATRTFVYMIYAYKNLKPNVAWLIFIEVAFTTITVLTWQDALDLLPLFAMLVVGYGSWQDNHLILRISYLINQSLYVIYKAIITAYISMSVDAINLTCTIICIVYYCILKKETPILKLIFKRNKNKPNETAESNGETDFKSQLSEVDIGETTTSSKDEI